MRFFLTRLFIFFSFIVNGQSFTELDSNRTWIFDNCLGGKIELELNGYLFKDGIKIVMDKEHIIYPTGKEEILLTSTLKTINKISFPDNILKLTILPTVCVVSISIIENPHPFNEWELTINYLNGGCSFDVYIPNITKDIFKPFCLGSYKMIIFDRWGSKIYEGEEWNTLTVEEGVYVYLITYNQKQYSGSITVVK